MKRILLLLVLLLSYESAHSQLFLNRGLVYLKYGHYFNKGGGTNTLYGINGEFLIRPRIGLNYNLEFQRYQKESWQLHSSMGTVGGPVLILIGLGTSSTIWGQVTKLGEWGIAAGIAILALPDGISYHIPIGYNWDIAPYINFLGLDFVRDPNLTENRLKYSWSTGVKCTFWTYGNFNAHGIFEYRHTLNWNAKFGAALGVGLSFGKRPEKEFRLSPRPLEDSIE